MPETSAPSPVCKVRLRFAKAGDLRFLSHHDLMRLLERLLRRAGLPFRSTEGFHPKAKITFASALSLGIAGRQEVVEIEFDGELDPDNVQKELQTFAPEGLKFLAARAVPPKKTAQPIRAVYHFPLPPDACPELAAKIDELLALRSLVISRTRNVPLRPAQEEPLAEERLDALTNAEPVPTKVELKKFDIRPLISRLWRDGQGFWMDVYLTNQGAARPEELLRLVDLEESWLDGDAVLERVTLEIEDEVDPRSQALPGNALPRTAPPSKVDAASPPRPHVQALSPQGPAPADAARTPRLHDGSQGPPANQGKSMQTLASLRAQRLPGMTPDPSPLTPQNITPVPSGPTEKV